MDPVEANEWFHSDITKQQAAEKLARCKYTYLSCIYVRICPVMTSSML